jgi:hypothetical protein
MVRSLALCFVLGTSACGVISSDSSSANTQNALTVEVSSAPPADNEEGDRPAKPDGPFIWVNGYWENMGGNYVWRDGRWVQARPQYEYVRARYEFNGKSWLFHRPHWRKRQRDAAAGST